MPPTTSKLRFLLISSAFILAGTTFQPANAGIGDFFKCTAVVAFASMFPSIEDPRSIATLIARKTGMSVDEVLQCM